MSRLKTVGAACYLASLTLSAGHARASGFCYSSRCRVATDAETKQLRLELDAFVASRLKDKTYQLSDGEQRFFSKCQLQSSIANGYLTGAITSAAIFWSASCDRVL